MMKTRFRFEPRAIVLAQCAGSGEWSRSRSKVGAEMDVIALLSLRPESTNRQCDNVPRTPRLALGGRVAEGQPVVELARAMTVDETSGEAVGVAGACATNGACPAMPDMQLGTDEESRS